MEKLELEINKESSVTLNKLLNRLTTHQISLAEYLTEGAYWYMSDTFNTISWKPMPTKPSEVRDFEKLTYNQKDRLTDEYYDDNYQIGIYYESLYLIKCINVGNYKNMLLVYQHIPEGDTVNREKLRKKINYFNNRIEWRRGQEWKTEFGIYDMPEMANGLS